jgi:DNA (cytosine-5)-methyltransferase 1
MNIWKVLNLYAGIGGNRTLWKDIDVTAVEQNKDIAAIYADLYPLDTVIIDDAHQYLLKHYTEYDFIWTSPPCPTHGQYRYNVGVRAKGYKGIYPDMKLYEEIIFLQYHFTGLYVVENVISYYDPLIQPQKIGRHYIWANYPIQDFDSDVANIRSKNKISDFDIDLSKYHVPNKRQILRNCVNPDLGLHILNSAQKFDALG